MKSIILSVMELCTPLLSRRVLFVATQVEEWEQRERERERERERQRRAGQVRHRSSMAPGSHTNTPITAYRHWYNNFMTHHRKLCHGSGERAGSEGHPCIPFLPKKPLNGHSHWPRTHSAALKSLIGLLTPQGPVCIHTVRSSRESWEPKPRPLGVWQRFRLQSSWVFLDPAVR